MISMNNNERLKMFIKNILRCLIDQKFDKIRVLTTPERMLAEGQAIRTRVQIKREIHDNVQP